MIKKIRIYSPFVRVSECTRKVCHIHHREKLFYFDDRDMRNIERIKKGEFDNKTTLESGIILPKNQGRCSDDKNILRNNKSNVN